MIKEGKFGPQEGICLITITIAAKVFFTSPSALVNLVGTAGWLMTLISSLTTIIIFYFVYLLLKRFPNKGLVEIFEITYGRVIAFIICIITCIATVFLAAINMREFAEVLKVYSLPLTPPSFIIGIFVIGVIVFCYLGLETIARFAKLFAYILLFGLLVVLFFGFRNYEFYRLFPLLGYGIKPIIKHGLIRSSAYVEVIIIAVIAPSLQGAKYIKHVGFISLIISGLLISGSILAFSLTFPYFIAKEVTSPMYQLTTLIDYGRFFQRIDPVFLFVWIISSFISIIAVFYTFLSIYCKMFKIQDMRPIVFPAAIILFAVSMLPKDLINVIKQVKLTRSYGWLLYYPPLIIALILAKIRKKGTQNA